MIRRVPARPVQKRRAQLDRDLNREIKLICDKYDINIPFPQIVVNQPTVSKQASEWEKEQARRFTEEQRELSANIMNEDEDER